MKKLKYTKPEIVSVTFRLENGMEGSLFGLGGNRSSMYNAHERFLYDEGVGTGETYGTYTDGDGEYATGRW